MLYIGVMPSTHRGKTWGYPYIYIYMNSFFVIYIYIYILPLKNSPARPQEITVALKLMESEKYK